uniref:2-oxoisovalerate dehydrogenase subunit alpha n=1 Tax=Paramoeba aestuarina TaxID=180227 RepID=A0A7S4NL75_9EUKA|mmetsp:Transcript_19449/g.30479  ORF Transcript_19449/g.30479 Transcript_19449/m.30479 type:complete len:411 (+) Transcript_19449:17-1249(+)
MLQRCSNRLISDQERIFRFSRHWNLKYESSQACTTGKLQFTTPSQPIPIFQLLSHDGILSEEDCPRLNGNFTKDIGRRIMKTMVQQQTLDKILHDCQRQGRISFYLTSDGELASIVGSAAGLHPSDIIYGQYRESGALLYRGYPVEKMIAQCIGSVGDRACGRQMPIHYGSKEHNFHTISSPVGTQLTHAAGCGYGLAFEKKDNVCMCYFGEGTSSEGDFHAALNMSSTLHCQTLFFCRNNAFAISTPCVEQYAGNGIASYGASYGIPSIRVDGNDAVAVFMAVHEARALSIEKQSPVLIEAMTYRMGDHSTSDDSTKYRDTPEDALPDPIKRFERFLAGRSWWGTDETQKVCTEFRDEILQMLTKHEALPKPSDRTLLDHVYDIKPQHLIEQTAQICTKEIDFLRNPTT